MIGAIVYPLVVLVWLGLALWGVRLYNRGRSLAAMLIILTALVLALDALVIAIGRRSLEDVGWLIFLNQARLWLRAAVLPLLALAAFEMARRGGAAWAGWRIARPPAWLATAALAALGALTGPLRPLHPVCYAGTLRYAVAAPAGQLCGSADPVISGGWPVALFLIALAALILGGFLWRASRRPWLIIGGAGLALALLLPAAWGPLVGAAGEIWLVVSLLLAERALVRNLNLYDFHADG